MSVGNMALDDCITCGGTGGENIHSQNLPLQLERPSDILINVVYIIKSEIAIFHRNDSIHRLHLHQMIHLPEIHRDIFN